VISGKVQARRENFFGKTPGQLEKQRFGKADAQVFEGTNPGLSDKNSSELESRNSQSSERQQIGKRKLATVRSN
jgi:hypothetical protein